MEEEEADLLQPAAFLRHDKWFLNMSGGAGTAGTSPSFGPSDSGYTSYQSVTPNNTFNGSCSRHGASSTLAPIDEANETDCSMNDSSTGLPLSAQVLTPTTAASIDRISNFHLTTPKTRRLPFAGDGVAAGAGETGEGGASASSVKFMLPTTPERAPFPRSQSFEAYQTPLRTVNRTQSQLTPHKAKGSARDSLKRKLPSGGSARGKLHSDSDVDAMLDEENQENDPNDSLVTGCRRLSDDLPSPIPRSKRLKRHEGNNITDMMRSSTPKTTCYLGDENHHGNGPVLPSNAGRKPLFRKYTSYSPRKIQNIRQLGTGGGMLRRQNAFSTVQVTPEKKERGNRVADIASSPTTSFGQLVEEGEEQQVEGKEEDGGLASGNQAPIGIGALLDGPILTESCSSSSTKEATSSAFLEDAMATVPSSDNYCSFTPTKSFVSEDENSMVERHAPVANQPTMLASILEEPSYGVLPALDSQPSLQCAHPAVASVSEDTSFGVMSTLDSSPPQPLQALQPQYNVHASPPNVKQLSKGYSSGYVVNRPPLPRSELRAGPSPKVKQRSATSAPKPKHYYEGRKYLDILRRLHRDNPDALGLLLNYLTDADLVQVVRVSPDWHSIVYGHPKSLERLQRQLRLEAKHKENRYGPACGSAALDTKLKPKPETTALESVSKVLFPSSTSEETVPLPASVEVERRRPFAPCNSQDRRNSTSSSSTTSSSNSSLYGGTSFGFVGGNGAMPELLRRRSSVTDVVTALGNNNNNNTSVKSHSPPVSPSKRKFYDNQKWVLSRALHRIEQHINHQLEMGGGFGYDTRRGGRVTFGYVRGASCPRTVVLCLRPALTLPGGDAPGVRFCLVRKRRNGEMGMGGKAKDFEK
uniref:F-box domain-containing protein n=1 Tax=Anopheles albimanus TaxID=7167 RepID=A0A182FU16_ANOAL